MSLTLPHPRAPVTTGMDALLICEPILHRLGLLRFPHLCLDLCTGPHVHSVPSCPFHCFQSHCCLPQLSPQQGRRITPGCFQQRCWEAEAVAEAGRSQGCWQRPTRGLLRESPGQQTLTSLTAEIWRGHILSLRGCGAKEKEQGTGAEATESQSWCPAVSPEDTLLGDCRSLMNHQAGSNSSYSCSCCYEIIAKNNVIELSPFFFLGFYTFQVIINFSWFCIWYQIKVQFPCSVCGCLAFLALSTEDNPSLISHLSLLRTGWVHVVWVPYSIPSCLSFCFHAILFQS